MNPLTRRRFAQHALALGPFGATAPLSWSKDDNYPNRALTCIVGFPAGGSVDFVARVIVEKIGARLGQPFVVENRPGAAGNLAAGVAARAAPTGYTLFVATSANAVSPYLYKSLQYDPQKDFVYISRWITTSYMVVVNANHPARSLDELIRKARENSGNVSLGTQGPGTPPHLAGELLSKSAGIRVLQVPFKGGPETMTALLSGLIDFTFAPIPVALPHVRSGRLRLLAMTSPQRSSLYPNVPTVAEQGLPGYEVSAWYGLVAPAGTPRSIINTLSAHTEAVLALADVREKLAVQGMEAAPLGPAAFANYFSTEIKFYERLVADANIEKM